LLCGRCEVRAECLELALDTNEDYGIWGGLSTAERKALRRRRRLRRTLDRAGVALPFELDEPGCGLSRGRRGGSLMTAVHEVIAVSGECLYRGRDVELACEVYEASPAGTRLVCRHDPAPAGQRPDPDAMSVADEPIPYRLSAIDESVPYALSKAGYAAADMFVVDTTNVAELRRRCPALFTRADTASSADRRRPARGVS